MEFAASLYTAFIVSPEVEGVIYGIQVEVETDVEAQALEELPPVMCDASGCTGVGDRGREWKNPEEQSTPEPRQS